MKKIKTVIVGCGNIAEQYVEQSRNYKNVELLGFVDILSERAQAFAEKHGGTAFKSLEQALSNPEVDLIVNLTIHHAHADVIEQCLEADKHVYTEKPFAMNYPDAQRLLALAKQKNLRLSSAPITYMGEAQQTAWKILREGRAGKIRLAYAEINHGRIETWHPNPKPFYEVGVLWDVAIYPLTVLTAFLGPARRASAFGRILSPKRKTLSGEKFELSAPDLVLVLVEFENGAVARLTSSFYAKDSKQGSSMEFHGDEGMVYLGSSFMFDAQVDFAAYGEEFVAEPFVRQPYEGVEFGRGLQEAANAICEDRPHVATAEHAAHVIETICAIEKAMLQEKSVEISSRFPPLALMPWAE